MPVEGGTRDRLIGEALWRTVQDGLDGLGWFDAGRAHRPIDMQRTLPPAGEEIALNTLAMSAEDMDGDDIELGSNLTEDRHIFYWDFYAESDALGREVIGDVRDILRGKHTAASRDRAVIDVYDYRVDPLPGTVLFTVLVDRVVVDRSRDPGRAWEEHWHMARVELLDER